MNSLTGTGSNVTLTASTTIHATSLASNAGGLTASGSEVHLPALASNAGGASLTGSAVDLSALASNAGGLTVGTAWLFLYLSLLLM